jgi:hypothetical protein
MKICPAVLELLHEENRAMDMTELTAAFLQYYSSVGIAKGYGLDCRGIGVRFSAKVKDISLLHSVQTSPPSLIFNGYREFNPRG